LLFHVLNYRSRPLWFWLGKAAPYFALILVHNPIARIFLQIFRIEGARGHPWGYNDAVPLGLRLVQASEVQFGIEDPDWLPFLEHAFPIRERILLCVIDTQLLARAARKMLGNEVRSVFYWGSTIQGSSL
jgi:hypothetical protein